MNVAIVRTTPTGNLLSLDDAPNPPGQFDVAAKLVADRMFELVATPGDNASGDLPYDKIERAVAMMLAEGSMKVTVQWT